MHALSDVSLHIGGGELVVLLGQSGSGKTTMLNVIGGIEPVTAGTVDIGGVDVASLTGRELTEYRRTTVGFVFQFFNLVPTLTAAENVEVCVPRGAAMTGATTSATTVRVLRQLGRDRRTLALLLGVPTVLLTLVRYAFDSRPEVFQRVGLPLIGVFPLVSMFLVASIAMLRERRSGTLERLMALPTTRLGLLVGYAGSFALVACLQTVIVMVVGVGLLGLDITGPLWLALVVAVANALLGMALGLFLSAFAHTEFQAIQFMPAFLLPQFLLCGLLAPRPAMARPLELVSDVLPLTFAYDALRGVADRPGVPGDVVVDLIVTVLMGVVALGLGALTLRRQTG